MTALDYFDQSVAREKAARAAKGMPTELDADTLRIMRQCAENFHEGHEDMEA